MLHGITGHAEAYVRNLAAHAEHFSCWAIDFIGHGYSSKPDHPLEVRHYVDQVTHDEGGWKFASKTVVLDSRQIDTLLAIPI